MKTMLREREIGNDADELIKTLEKQPTRSEDKDADQRSQGRFYFARLRNDKVSFFVIPLH